MSNWFERPAGCGTKIRSAVGSTVRHRVVCGLVFSTLLAISAASCAAASSGDGANTPARRYEIQTGGRSRSYLLHVPPSYSGKPVPLLVALHPALATGERMEQTTHFDTLADSEGFIVAYPDGIDHRWNAGKCCGEPMTKNIDDLGFIDAMVAAIAARYAIDPARHFVTGFSNGGFLVHHIACLEPTDFAAYATVAGTLTTPDCPGVKPTPFLLIHGAKDTEVAWEGGERWGYQRPSIPKVLKTLATRNHCSQNDAAIESTPPANCRHYEGCGANEVQWCVIDGVGHQWPGSGETIWPWLLGPNTSQFDASRRIWEFFTQYPRQ